MSFSKEEGYCTELEKRIGITFETGDLWLVDEPNAGEALNSSMAEQMGEAFSARLPTLVMPSEMEEIDQLLTKIHARGDKMAVIRVMTDIHRHIDFLYLTDPDKAWENYRETVHQQERHIEMFGEEES